MEVLTAAYFRLGVKASSSIGILYDEHVGGHGLDLPQEPELAPALLHELGRRHPNRGLFLAHSGHAAN